MCKPKPDSEGPGRFVCGTSQLHQHNLLTVPGYKTSRQFVEQFNLLASPKARQRSWTANIPVVVHVVYNTASQNISQAQIDSQIETLNKDFSGTNPDLSTVPSVFKPLIGNPNINFFLAKRDPSGKPTTGVTRTQTSIVSFDHNSSNEALDERVKFTAQGGADAWPSDRYLNIWVSKQGGLKPLLGYAQFPAQGVRATDGVVISHVAFGSNGTATAPFHLGRTATHEIGHWLDLKHIWGDDDLLCSMSDDCDDTPNQGGFNQGKPKFPTISCKNEPNGDLFMNYMDYCDDDVTVMFTKGQVERVSNTLAGARSSLFSSNFRDFILQNGTGLHETDDTFQFIVTDWNGDGYPDLVAIKKSGTGSGMTEVHILSGQSRFQTFLLQTGTALHETDESFEFLMAKRKGNNPPDLFAIKKSKTGSNSTEIHLLSGVQHYASFALQTNTILHETDDTFQFALADWTGNGSSDLVAIKKRNTGSGSTEVHILSAPSGYQSYLLQTKTALHETDETFEFMVTDWNGDGRPDVLAVKKSNADKSYTEVHILSGRQDFQEFLLHSDTVLQKTHGNFQFAVADWDHTGRPDLVAIKKRFTGTGMTEVHILAG